MGTDRFSVSMVPLMKAGRKPVPERFENIPSPSIMGILNITPDSFSDGGRYQDLDAATQRVLEMVEQGADFIDIGGESTRPFADPVPLDVEIGRTIPVIESVVDLIEVPISIDTRHVEVAKLALEAGASMVNDVNGLRAEGMDELVADSGASAVIMHMKGSPKNMQVSPGYEDVISDIHSFLSERVSHMVSLGVPRKHLMIDPGIGFGKRVSDNLMILRDLESFSDIGCPILVGASRKSFIGHVLGLEVEDRLEGSLAAALISAINGASVLRVHDVKETKLVMKMLGSIRDPSSLL
ncbi:MAG: dihydropteroate synthase [Thermoplasmatota archaeon]